MTLNELPQNRRILIVDDNRMIHEDFKKILVSPEASEEFDAFEAKLLGKKQRTSSPAFELMFAAQGRDAAQIVNDGMKNGSPIALAFIDIRMPPGWDGVETIEHIWEYDPRVQIAICTAYSDHTCEDIAERFRHTDQLLFIRKPFDSIEIFQIACAMVNKWNLAQQASRQMSSLEEAVRLRTKELELSNEKQREMEKQFHQAQKMEAIGRLTGGVAHDFNNLLTVVLCNIELLMARKPALDTDVLDKLLSIQKASDGAAELTQQFLAFSRQQVVSPELIDLNQILDQRLRKMLERIIGEDIELNINLMPSPATVKADRGQIEQVIMNLVVNARDAMEERGGKLEIQTSQREGPNKEQMVALTTSDTGTGMTIAVKEKIFEPFYTTKEVGKGTGLGLSTVYGIVTRHNGQISVESELNRGTTFTICFPFEKGACKSVEPKRPNDELFEGIETILLVEDEEPLRSLARQILNTAGYCVIEAENGLDAYQLCTSKKPQFSLVITDVIMPKMGGKELAFRLSTLLPNTPVLFMSGYIGQEPLLEGLGKQAANFLQKPFLPREFLQRVRSILDRLPPTTESASPN